MGQVIPEKFDRRSVQEKSHSLPGPPTVEEVTIYFVQRGMSESEAEHFFLFFQGKGWKNRKGETITNWKGLAYKRVLAILAREPWRFDKSIH